MLPFRECRFSGKFVGLSTLAIGSIVEVPISKAFARAIRAPLCVSARRLGRAGGLAGFCTIAVANNGRY